LVFRALGCATPGSAIGPTTAGTRDRRRFTDAIQFTLDA